MEEDAYGISRMAVSNADFYCYEGKEWKVNNLPSGCDLDILDAMFNLVFAYQSYHYRMLAIRYDLHQPKYVEDNKRMTVFFRRLNKRLSSKYKGIDMKYLWVREQAKVDAPHYHILLLLNGQKVNYPENISKICNDIWSDMGGMLYYPENLYYDISRGNTNQVGRLLYRVSYLAKGKDKDKRPVQTG
ncbi:inovirus-type Gp2 protein [Shewanella yunxiaonensis]|uniref:Inovirus-type Gp2 protein n=1 Tax=Shewanella yunxiaonensis TaxID=2829809 RepID=A0ABX7YQI3_9GAMM|nr:inovirus-type Gp2 protein [Shewanella yunxiaonensis]QUN04778.1 inovirus-type Gp2 protein [Shewanella yunxiaonensis]